MTIKKEKPKRKRHFFLKKWDKKINKEKKETYPTGLTLFLYSDEEVKQPQQVGRGKSNKSLMLLTYFTIKSKSSDGSLLVSQNACKVWN